jgi:hypothetical protein
MISPQLKETLDKYHVGEHTPATAPAPQNGFGRTEQTLRPFSRVALETGRGKFYPTLPTLHESSLMYCDSGIVRQEIA